MAVFRIAQTKDYVTMSNRHFKNKNLSLKAKGLLSQTLSLPEEWYFTLKGLAHINKESVDAVRTATWRPEKEGYVVAPSGTKSNGKMGETDYTIFEILQK